MRSARTRISEAASSCGLFRQRRPCRKKRPAYGTAPASLPMSTFHAPDPSRLAAQNPRKFKPIPVGAGTQTAGCEFQNRPLGVETGGTPRYGEVNGSVCRAADTKTKSAEV